MGDHCKSCGKLVISNELHECSDEDDQGFIHFPVVNDTPGAIGIRRSRIESASWSPTADGYAEISITLKSGSIHIHKVDRHTAIRVCRNIMTR